MTHWNIKPKVLIVDNDPRTTWVLDEWLKENYNILIANDREEALCIMEQIQEIDEKIKLLITDLHISWSHAWELLIDFKNKFVESPVIILTSDVTDARKHITSYLKWVFDFDNYKIPIIAKPFSIKSIAWEIEKLLKNYKYQERRLPLQADLVWDNSKQKRNRRETKAKKKCSSRGWNEREWKKITEPAFSLKHFKWHVNVVKSNWQLLKEWLISFFRYNDWTINRWKKIEEILWWSIAMIIQFVIEFRISSWISSLDKTSKDKIMCLDVWWWDWSTMDYLRKLSFSISDKQRASNKIIDHVSIADVYHTHLFDLLIKFVKPIYINNSQKFEAIKECISVITNEISSQVRNYSEEDLPQNEKFSRLTALYRDINWIKIVLKNLSDYIQWDIKIIKTWWEFENEKDYEIWDQCRELINEAVNNSERFFKKYFKSNLLRDSYSLEDDIQLYRENFLLMNFNDIRLLMPLVPTFWIVYACKSMSHIWDKNFERMTLDFFKLLLPWWIFIWDGFKESYTRYLRINEIRKFMKHDNNSNLAKVYVVINNEDEISSLLIHKWIETESGTQFIDKKKLQLFTIEWYRLNCLEKYIDNHQEIVLLNDVIYDLKRKLMYDYQVNIRLLDLNVLFKKLHWIITEMIDRVVSEESWQDIMQINNPEEKNAIFAHLRVKILNDLEWSSDLIRLRNLLYRQAPWKNQFLGHINSKPTIIQSFPIDDSMPNGLNSRRIMFPALMPDNSDIQSIQDNSIRREIVNNLQILKDEIWTNCLHLFEFGNCFTNFPMFDSLNYAMNWNLLDLWKVTNIDLKWCLDNIQIPDEWIIILWWSLDDVYDQYWFLFVEKFVKPLIEKIRNWANIRLLWICFGHQAIASAMWYPTVRWALEFWMTPVQVSEEACQFTNGLQWKLLTMVNTRTWYSLIWKKEDWNDIYWNYMSIHSELNNPLVDNQWALKNVEPFTSHVIPFILGDLNTQSIQYPPVLVSYLNGKIVWSQLHLESQLSSKKHRDIFINASEDFVWSCLISQWRKIIEDIRSNIELVSEDKKWEETSFLKSDAWIIILQNILLEFSKSLISEF